MKSSSTIHSKHPIVDKGDEQSESAIVGQSVFLVSLESWMQDHRCDLRISNATRRWMDRKSQRKVLKKWRSNATQSSTIRMVVFLRPVLLIALNGCDVQIQLGRWHFVWIIHLHWAFESHLTKICAATLEWKICSLANRARASRNGSVDQVQILSWTFCAYTIAFLLSFTHESTLETLSGICLITSKHLRHNPFSLSAVNDQHLGHLKFSGFTIMTSHSTPSPVRICHPSTSFGNWRISLTFDTWNIIANSAPRVTSRSMHGTYYWPTKTFRIPHPPVSISTDLRPMNYQSTYN